MAKFDERIIMTITNDDRAWLAFGNHVLAEICDKMQDEKASCLVNSYTGEVIEEEQIRKAFWLIDSLIDKQTAWTWELHE